MVAKTSTLRKYVRSRAERRACQSLSASSLEEIRIFTLN